jgi:hypothetical protein
MSSPSRLSALCQEETLTTLLPLSTTLFPPLYSLSYHSLHHSLTLSYHSLPL